MVKNSLEGNRQRAARRRAELENRGVEQFQVIAPPEAKPLIRAAALLMTRQNAPMEPRAALRQAGGSNEPDGEDPSSELRATLETAQARIAEIEREAEAQRAEKQASVAREQTLLAERDAAKVAEAAEREKAQTMAAEVQKLGQAAEKAHGRAVEALGRAEKAEEAIWQTKAIPGIKGRLVRWLAGDVLRHDDTPLT